MSRAKVGYEFCPFPRKLHPAWAGRTLQVRGVMYGLFELNDGGPIVTSGAWLDSLCKQMMVDGRDRPNTRKTLLQLQREGLLSVDSTGTVRVTFHPTSDQQLIDVRSTSPQRPVDVPSTTGAPPVDIPLDSTPRNDTTHVRQTEEKDKKEETRERDTRARPDLVGFNWYCQLLELLPTSAPAPGSWREQYAFMGSRPDAERVAVAASIRADVWCMANKHLVSPEHVRKHWQKYLGGDARPVLKPVVATPREQLEKARERLQDAAKTLRIIEGLPWFDKEKPTYPGRLAQATADVSRLRGELAKLESGFTRPAVAS